MPKANVELPRPGSGSPYSPRCPRLADLRIVLRYPEGFNTESLAGKVVGVLLAKAREAVTRWRYRRSPFFLLVFRSSFGRGGSLSG
jgi:hypothetical protein